MDRRVADPSVYSAARTIEVDDGSVWDRPGRPAILRIEAREDLVAARAAAAVIAS